MYQKTNKRYEKIAHCTYLSCTEECSKLKILPKRVLECNSLWKSLSTIIRNEGYFVWIYRYNINYSVVIFSARILFVFRNIQFSTDAVRFLSSPPRKLLGRLSCIIIIYIITVKRPVVVVFTRRVFHVVHVVRPDVLGAGHHVPFAQQRPEVTDVGVGHAAVLAPDVAHVVYDLGVRCHRRPRRRPLPSALKGPMQKHPSDIGHGRFWRVHNDDELCRYWQSSIWVGYI